MHDQTLATLIDTRRDEAVCGLPVIVYVITMKNEIIQNKEYSSKSIMEEVRQCINYDCQCFISD